MFFQLKERFYASASPLLYDTANDKSKSGLDLKAKTIASVHALLLPLPDALKQAIYALPLAGYGISARPPRLTRKVRVGADKDSVIRTNSLTNIGIPCAVGMVYSHQMPWEERKVKLEKFFTKLFGQKYKIYDAFAKNDTFFEMADEVDVTLSYDDLIRNMRMLGIDVPDVSKDRVKWMKRFSFRLTMTFRSRQFLREGVIPDFNIREYQSILDLNIYVMTSYPMADALAMLSCEDAPPNFSLYDFLGHIQPIEAFGWNIKELNGIKVGGGRGLSEARYGKSMAVRQTMAAFTDLANTVGNVKPRTNEDGYAILVNGAIVKTNFEPQFEDFKVAVKNLYDQETKEFKSDSESTAPLADKVLAVDWQGNALVYTNSYGRYEFKDLKGSMPLTLHTIADLLDTTPGTYIANTMAQAVKAATGSTLSYMWASYSPKELMNPERTSNDQFDADFQSRQRDAALIRSLGEKWNEMQVTISRRMEFSFYIDLYNKYAAPLYAEKAYASRKDEIQEYSKTVPFKKELTLSGVKGLTHVMPHQFRILSDMTQRAPKNALLGVEPGGGKTSMYISDIAGLMSNRTIKRPAVVCPKGLRPNVIREILRFGGGELRYFVIDTARWDRFTMGQDAPFQEAPFEAFKKLILSQPANTIFLIDYGFLKLRSKQIKVGNVSMYTYPFAVWLSQVFEYFVADESHKVKNIGSQLSEAFKTFTPYATYKRMASGTVIHNKASDLTGQIATFGPDILAPFAAELEGGTPTPAEVKEILGAMHKRVKHYNAETREWSFLLPKIRETIHTVPMTDRQFEFYTKAFEDITVELMANAEFAKSVNDPSAEDKIVEALRAALSPLEVFINAPGGNSKLAQGFRNTGVSKNDLVSTKVAYIDGIIDRHVKSGDTGKVIVMSYNKEVSKHFFETSKFKERALHYTAAAQKLEDLTEEFRSNDNLLVMFADETTLREGFNLQYASRIIRVQTVWTPGDFLQALARVVRPEVPDANGKLVYDRKYINFDWIVFEPSIEVAKMARLYSKIIRKALVDRLETDRKFAQWADGQMVEGHKDATGELVSYKDVPELIIKANTFTMNLASIQAMQTRDNLTDHVKAYSSYMLWMDNEFDAHKESLRRQAAEERGVDPASITDTALRMMAMRKVTHAPYEGEGIAAKYGNGYIPFLSNATPTIDLGLNLVPVTSVAYHESDGDEDEDEFSEEAEADNTTVDLNDTVVTEYGIGNVTRVNRLTVRVALEGLGKITIPKTEVLAPVTEADKNALAKIFAKMRKAGATPTLLTADKRGNPATHIIDFNKATTVAPPTVSPTEAIARVREAVSISAPKPVPVPTGLNLRNSPATLPTITNVKTAKTVSIKPPVANKPEEPKVAPVKPPVLPTVIKTEAPAKVVKPPVADAPKSPDVSLELSAVWIYGQPAIISTAKTAKGADDKLAADKLRELGFGRVPTMLMAQVRTWQGLQGILKYFDQEGYYIPDDYRQELLTAMKAMKVARDKMDKVVYDAKVARTFIIDNTRKVKDQAVEIHPFIMINEDEAYLMINAAISTAARPLMAKKPVAGVDRFERMDPYFIRFFKSKKMLIDNAMTWDDDTGVSIRNLKKFAASIKALN